MLWPVAIHLARYIWQRYRPCDRRERAVELTVVHHRVLLENVDKGRRDSRIHTSRKNIDRARRAFTRRKEDWVYVDEKGAEEMDLCRKEYVGHLQLETNVCTPIKRKLFSIHRCDTIPYSSVNIERLSLDTKMA